MNSLEFESSPYIEDIHKGLLEEGFFLLKKLHLNVGKKNKPFLRILLADKTGHLPAIYFGSRTDLQEKQQNLHEGDIVKISGIIEEYQGILQVKLLKIEKDSRKDWELSRFWKRTPYDRRELYRSLKKYLEGISDKALRELCFAFLKDRAFMKLFLEAPASRFIHHAYIGGLLEHTLHVLQVADSFGRIFQQADHDLLISGAFLHDIGKVDEYKYLFSIDHTSPGKLKGHTLLGYDRLQEKLRSLQLDPRVRLKLEHILLAHQGKKQWGAVEEPRFLEAFLIHAADSTDSSQFIFSNARRSSSGDDPVWSEFVSYLGREIYLG